MRLITCILLFALNYNARAEQCACATTNVHVRSGADTHHPVLTTLITGKCLPYKGDNSNGWVHVDYNGSDGYISGSYVTLGSCGGGDGGAVWEAGHPKSTGPAKCTEPEKSAGPSVQLSGCPHIVSRAEWGARPPKEHSPLHGAMKYAFVHHGAGGDCTTQDTCSHTVRSYQNYHMDSHGWSDIGYSFLVGEDGNAYEGRGWDTQGAHTKGYNTVGLGFCMIGNFQDRLPNQAALDTLQKLIECGKAHGKLQSNYVLRGHRDMGTTACPGQRLYDLIKTWPHY
ncbi:peptidoglycan recognition protein 1-like [Gigantopelta aegis]|uniref:peptidoglycan recognition protein 1-like n=1 Tax=Gigantopelta aegis TaxID=1735272 RepID=UPI001B889CBB|nr:peptidoglycan recognition protein 1-like [Gigantopelta aegis]XP_041366405.1 peptidoglycan recognition protein 1-like [Gigantopelta aegis]